MQYLFSQDTFCLLLFKKKNSSLYLTTPRTRYSYIQSIVQDAASRQSLSTSSRTSPHYCSVVKTVLPLLPWNIPLHHLGFVISICIQKLSMQLFKTIKVLINMISILSSQHIIKRLLKKLTLY